MASYLRMEEFYRSRISAGEFRRFDPAVAVRAVNGMIIGLIILKGLEGGAGALNWLPQGKLTDELLDFVFQTKRVAND